MLQRIVNRLLRLDEALGDWRLGIESAEFHQQIDGDRPEFRGYAPTFFRDWRIIRRHLAINPKGAFIDYGAGLGRVTALAGRLPFAQVIGVEFDRSLAKRAGANISRASGLKADTQIVCEDAGDFSCPPNATVFYFCNPFTGAVLSRTLAQMRKVRPIQIVCNLPDESAFEQQICAVPWMRIDRRLALHGQRKCLIFRTEPD